jgi:hypothetical protein
MLKKNKKIIFKSIFPKMIDVFPDPEPIIKNLPEWFKEQEAYVSNNLDVIQGTQLTTVKKCTAFFDIVSCGYVLKCPYDLYIDTTGENPIYDIPQTLKGLNPPMIGSHVNSQISKYPIDNDLYESDLLRINMVWLIKTPLQYSSLIIDVQHGDKIPIKAVSAIVDTDTFLTDGLFSFIVKKGYKGIIKKGTPLVQVIPIKRDIWVSEKINDNKILDQLRSQRYIIRSVFSNGYKKYFWNKKEYK